MALDPLGWRLIPGLSTDEELENLDGDHWWEKYKDPLYPIFPPDIPEDKPPSESISEICGKLQLSGSSCNGCGQNCDNIMLDLFDYAEGVHNPPSGSQKCNEWAYDFGNPPDTPCYRLTPAAWDYYAPTVDGDLFPGHVGIQVTLCDGTVFYLDNQWWGTPIGDPEGGGSFWEPQNIWPVRPYVPRPRQPRLIISDEGWFDFM